MFKESSQSLLNIENIQLKEIKSNEILNGLVTFSVKNI